MKFPIVSAAAMLAVASISGGVAAQPMAPGAQIVITAENQRDWDRGNGLEAEGLRELGQAEQVLVQRSADVVNLENNRTSATSQAENARRTFEALRTETLIVDPDQAKDWAKQVVDAASDWEKFDDRIKDSNDRMDRAIRRRADAQEDVAKAQEKINRGRVMMAAAQRSSAAESN